MALFVCEWPENKTPIKTDVGVVLRNNGLFVITNGGSWIQLQLTPHEKRLLLRDLWKEFMQGELT